LRIAAREAGFERRIIAHFVPTLPNLCLALRKDQLQLLVDSWIGAVRILPDQ